MHRGVNDLPDLARYMRMIDQLASESGIDAT